MNSLELELSAQLFPERLVEVVSERLAGQLAIETVSADPDRLTIRIRSLRPLSSDVRSLFTETLVAVSVEHWATRPRPDLGTLPVRPHRRSFDVTFRFLSDASETQIVVSADPAIHHPISLLQALATMEGSPRITIESTNPVDRFVVGLCLADGVSMGRTIEGLLDRLHGLQGTRRASH